MNDPLAWCSSSWCLQKTTFFGHFFLLAWVFELVGVRATVEKRVGVYGFSIERARLAGETSLRLKCIRLQHRTCKTSRKHFASLVTLKKCLPIGNFDFFFFKNYTSRFKSLFTSKTEFRLFETSYPEFHDFPISRRILYQLSQNLKRCSLASRSITS